MFFVVFFKDKKQMRGACLDSRMSTNGEKMTIVISRQFHNYSIVPSLWIISALMGSLGKLVCMENSI